MVILSKDPETDPKVILLLCNDDLLYDERIEAARSNLSSFLRLDLTYHRIIKIIIIIRQVPKTPADIPIAKASTSDPGATMYGSESR
jgi:hypothetical protein